VSVFFEGTKESFCLPSSRLSPSFFTVSSTATTTKPRVVYIVASFPTAIERKMTDKTGRGTTSGGSNVVKAGKSEVNQPSLIPMSLFAAWDVDRTPPNCVPR